MRMLPLLALTLSLAACGSPETAANNDASADVPPASQQAAVPAELQVDNSRQAVPVTLPTPTAIDTLPAAFRGRWGMVPNDCDPKLDYMAKGLVAITADGLKFYESRATIGDLKQVTPTRVQAMLTYNGEGQTWQKATTLTLQDDGKTLIREETDPATADTYSKCPARTDNR